jgi:hypothetical protein
MRAGPLLAVLLLAACTGASPPPSPSAEPVRVLGEGLSVAFAEPFTVGAATDETEFFRLWQGFDRPEPPEVDLTTEVALYLGMAGSSSCPESFVRLVVDTDAALVFGEWQGPPGNVPCTDDLQSQGVLLAVSRTVLPQPEFLLQLREQLICPECAEHPDQLLVSLERD